MKIKKEALQRIVQIVLGHSIEKSDNICVHCHDQKWDVECTMFFTPAVNAAHRDNKGIPTIAFICQTCGFVKHFSADKLGITNDDIILPSEAKK